MSSLTITTKAGPMNAYLATPPSGTGPVIILIQEIFGVNQVMRDRADELAAQGYFALCPDLFWRIEPGIDITDRTEAEWKRAFELFGAFNVDTGIDDLASALAAARSLPGSTGKVGAIGYCLGGRLAYLMATRTDVDASIGYYGVMIDQQLDEASKITNPLILHIAGKDQFVPPPSQAKMHEVLDPLPLVTLYDYPDCDHAFARPGGQHFDATAAELANSRSTAFFEQHLR